MIGVIGAGYVASRFNNSEFSLSLEPQHRADSPARIICCTFGNVVCIITSGMIFVAYCAGNIAGPQFVYPREAPRYSSATVAMLAGYAVKTGAHLVLGCESRVVGQ
jgi:hypothetical protein